MRVTHAINNIYKLKSFFELIECIKIFHRIENHCFMNGTPMIKVAKCMIPRHYILVYLKYPYFEDNEKDFLTRPRPGPRTSLESLNST